MKISLIGKQIVNSIINALPVYQIAIGLEILSIYIQIFSRPEVL